MADDSTTTAMEEEDLELSLSLRPRNPSSSPSSSSLQKQQNNHHHPNKNILEPSSSSSQILMKRDEQAIRRHEAKLKRDLKRKSAAISKNDVVVAKNNNNDNGNRHQEEDYVERRRKVASLGFPAAAYNGGSLPYQGHYGNFDGGAGSISSGSSSGISDNYQSHSGLGGNSSDTGSHSSHPDKQTSPPNVPRACTTSQPQHCSTQLDDLKPDGSNPSQTKPQLFSLYSNVSELVSSGSRQFSKSPEVVTSSNTPNGQRNGSQDSNNDDKALSNKSPNTSRSLSPKETKGEIGKPPKPVGQTGQQKLVNSNMPCVSTTGNGPNGKTVTGFLCKYSKAEVSIVCVCHGASFSPAGFVEHAGGVDVEYPLRQIRVALPLTNHLS